MLFSTLIHSKSKTFLAFCFSFLLGVAAASAGDVRLPFLRLYLALFLSLSLIISLWKNRTLRFILGAVFFTVLGLARYTLIWPAEDHLSSLNGSTVMLTATVAEEPDVRIDGVRYIAEAHAAEPRGSKKGRVYFKTGLYPQYEYGEVLQIDCELQTPEPVEDFRYDRYLALSDVFTVCAQPKIQRRGEQGGNVLLRSVLSVKSRVAEKVDGLWPEPYASFIAGLLYGYRGGLGELGDLFAATGVTHIVAISGQNFSIIAGLFMAVCIHLLIPRKKAFWIVAGAMILFVLLVGASASVVRAATMGILVLASRQVGRISRSENMLVFAAALMVLHNPLVLLWDAGFHLSFLATAGILFVSPLINRALPAGNRLLEFFRESFVMTMSATITTLPLILYQFGRLSVVAPIVNVLILWPIPAIMGVGFVATLLSFLFYPLAQFVAWVAWAGMKYIVTIVTLFAALPFASVDFRLPLWAMLAVYAGMVVVLLRKRRNGSSQ